MILKYGTYTHGDCECAISISRETWRDGTGKRRGYLERWTITGRIFASGADLVANLTAQINAIETAYASDGSNLILYESDGTTPTGHGMTSSSMVGGVKVSGPSFPSGKGPEYATYREYTITAEGKYESDTHEILSFGETISVSGTGGAKFIMLTPLDGAPIKQTIASKTPVVISQSGSAVGRSGYPTPPNPVSAINEHKDTRNIQKKNPERQADGTYKNYEITWQYTMEKTSDFTSSQKTPSTWI